MTGTEQQPTLEVLFESAIRIEELASIVYRDLAELFAHHPHSLALWRSLAADEELHARVLARVLAAAPVEKRTSPAPAETWATVAEVLQRLDQDPVGTVTNLQDAYELAHEFEHSEVNAIFEFLSIDLLPGAIEAEFVRTHIAQHQQKLADFRQSYQGEDWRQVLPR
jgi:rubrerythrin